MAIVGENAIVTGASQGIGRAIAKGLIEEGLNVALVARNEANLKSLAEETKDAPGKAVVIPCDVSVSENVTEMVRRAREELGDIHILVNSAGVLDNEGIAGHSDETWRWHYSVIVDSYFYTTRELIGDMMERGSGRIAPRLAVVADQRLCLDLPRDACPGGARLGLRGGLALVGHGAAARALPGGVRFPRGAAIRACAVSGTGRR